MRSQIRRFCAAAGDSSSRSRIGLYAGSFDPPSKGHLDIIRRGRKLCDALHIAVAINPNKKNIFSTDERVDLVRQMTAKIDGIHVDSFNGLIVDYAKSVNADFLVRGLRAYSDFEYEFRMAIINRKLTGIETCFFMADEKHSHISSTLIRELAHFGKTLPEFVPEAIQEQVYKRLGVPYTPSTTTIQA